MSLAWTSATDLHELNEYGWWQQSCCHQSTNRKSMNTINIDYYWWLIWAWSIMSSRALTNCTTKMNHQHVTKTVVITKSCISNLKVHVLEDDMKIGDGPPGTWRSLCTFSSFSGHWKCTIIFQIAVAFGNLTGKVYTDFLLTSYLKPGFCLHWHDMIGHVHAHGSTCTISRKLYFVPCTVREQD